MPRLPAPAPFTDADYEMIAAAVLETARGRWFLAEHARRNRNADTRLVLDAIERLERLIAQRGQPLETDRVRFDLVEMMNAITRTKSEIAAIRPGRDAASHFDEASNELDAIIGATEKATSDILAAAERVQEIAWALREQGVDAAICDLIDTHATAVYTACSFQDLTGQRIRKVIDVLRFLEDRINAMIKIWRLDDLEFMPSNVPAPPASLTQGPARPGEGLEQQAVDNLIGSERKQDVVWREGRVQDGRDPRNLGEFDLEDLVVFDTSPETHPAEASAPQTETLPSEPSGPPQSASEAASAAESKEQDRNSLASLSLAERMALFS
jgi:chemotaxis protein CheZ